MIFQIPNLVFLAPAVSCLVAIALRAVSRMKGHPLPDVQREREQRLQGFRGSPGTGPSWAMEPLFERISRGEYVTIFDSDDELLNNPFREVDAP